jgi:hypothetical protein
MGYTSGTEVAAMTSSKVCFKCGETKLLTEFYKHSMMADGHLNKCKSCTKRDVGKHRIENIDKVRAYDRERAKLPHRALAAAAQARKWRDADSRRMAAHNAVARAILKGTLQHKPCEWPGCKRDDSYAHHEDYGKPLQVIFYCQPHHKKRHAELKRLGIEP